MANKKPVLGYWNIRGFAQPNRLLLKYLGVDYEDKRYHHGGPPDYSNDDWLQEKFSLGLDFPNIPYWIDDKVKLTESKAVFRYLARMYGPDLVPETEALKGKSDMVEGFASDLQSALIQYSYAKVAPEEPIENALAPRFEQLSKFMGTNKWVLGDKLTYLDFYVYDVLYQFRKYNPDFFVPYPTLVNYLATFEAIPQLVEYIKETEDLKCFSPTARISF